LPHERLPPSATRRTRPYAVVPSAALWTYCPQLTTRGPPQCCRCGDPGAASRLEATVEDLATPGFVRWRQTLANRTLALLLPGGRQLFMTTGSALWTQQRSSGVCYKRRRYIRRFLFDKIIIFTYLILLHALGVIMTCLQYLHCALASCGAVYCNLSCLCVCVFATGGRVSGQCPSLTTASARAVFASL